MSPAAGYFKPLSTKVMSLVTCQIVKRHGGGAEQNTCLTDVKNVDKTFRLWKHTVVYMRQQNENPQ